MSISALSSNKVRSGKKRSRRTMEKKVMATEASKSVMTSEAFSFLECFISSFEDTIYDLATSIARSKKHISTAGEIEIAEDDVRDAADVVYGTMLGQTGHEIPTDTLSQIQERRDCVMAKCRS